MQFSSRAGLPAGGATEAMATAVRQHVVRMAHRGRSSHVGSGLSAADVLAVLYGSILRVDPAVPTWPDRDRFIMSKGHAGAAVYATLAEAGFFSRDILDTHYQNGSTLSGHVSHVGVPGVEVSTGSLGHGLPLAVGMAGAAKLLRRQWRTFVLMSDGECDEGTTWEGALFAAHHRLDGLTAVIDYNGLQSLTTTEETLALEPFADKWRAFGWDVREVDGHDHAQLGAALAPIGTSDRPVCVLAHTTKGKGVSFMESQVLWHYRAPDDLELARALSELDARS